MKSLTAKKLIKILLENDFILLRQKGSHMIWKNLNSGIIVSVPLHGKSKSIPIGTMFAIIKQSKIDRQIQISCFSALVSAVFFMVAFRRNKQSDLYMDLKNRHFIFDTLKARDCGGSDCFADKIFCYSAVFCFRGINGTNIS